MVNIKILSTKKVLKTNLLQTQCGPIQWLEEDFIGIEMQSFSVNHGLDLLLFTSQNAVEGVLNYEKAEELKAFDCICVGQKTKDLLEKNNFRVLDFAHYAEDLSLLILEKYANRKFTFFNGNLRRDTLPDLFCQNNISCEEIQVYTTKLFPKKIEEEFDAVVFYSPSGVKSFLEENKIENQLCFCIGTTTAEALQNVTQNILLPPQPTIDSLMDAIKKYYCNKN